MHHVTTEPRPFTADYLSGMIDACRSLQPATPAAPVWYRFLVTGDTFELSPEPWGQGSPGAVPFTVCDDGRADTDKLVRLMLEGLAVATRERRETTHYMRTAHRGPLRSDPGR